MSVGGVGGKRGPDFEPEPVETQAAGEAESAGKILPRSGWKDEGALAGTVGASKTAVAEGQSRPNHRLKWLEAKRPGTDVKTYGTEGPASLALAGARRGGKADKAQTDRPVIVAKYGVPFPGGGGWNPDRPVIVAKYGVPFPGPGVGGDPDRPVIVAKYGVPFPGPGGGGGGGGTHPVIVAKYGVPFPGPGGGGGTPDHPVIVAKYGVPFPGPGKRDRDN